MLSVVLLSEPHVVDAVEAPSRIFQACKIFVCVALAANLIDLEIAAPTLSSVSRS